MNPAGLQAGALVDMIEAQRAYAKAIATTNQILQYANREQQLVEVDRSRGGNDVDRRSGDGIG